MDIHFLANLYDPIGSYRFSNFCLIGDMFPLMIAVARQYGAYSEP